VKLVEMLASLGACRDGLDWLRGHENLPDSAIWLAVEDPTWLMLVLELANSVDATTLYQVTAPLLAAWREAKRGASDEFEAHDVLDTYTADLRMAGQTCCAMIRATVAMPTRHQLADAVAARPVPEFGKF